MALCTSVPSYILLGELLLGAAIALTTRAIEKQSLDCSLLAGAALGLVIACSMLAGCLLLRMSQ